MQVRVFGQEPHTHAVAHQSYPANQRKESELHPGIVPGALLKYPGNTEHIACEEATA